MPLRPEPFSQQQQRRCRHDGEVEEMHDDAPRRPLIPVTEPEPNGHIRAEADRAALEQRAARDPYRELPLTGAVQSMMPTYRLSDSFGRIRPPDEYGYYLDAEAAAEHEVSCGLCTAGGEGAAWIDYGDSTGPQDFRRVFLHTDGLWTCLQQSAKE